MTTQDSSILLSVLDNYGGHPFDDVYDVVFPCYGKDEVKAAADLSSRVGMVVWGGADISPSIYGQKAAPWTGAVDVKSRRDELEIECVLAALEYGIPIIGICRGAQLMCALSGGSLVQDVTGHAGGWHPIKTNDGRAFNCPTLHHQMMFPWRNKDRGPIDFEFLAWAEPTRSKAYRGEAEENDRNRAVLLQVEKEPEIIWIPSTRALCIQSHPEFIHEQHPFVDYCNELVMKYCLPTTEEKKDEPNLSGG